MLTFDTDKFLSGFAEEFGAPKEAQKSALSFLLDKVANDNDNWPTVQQFAYGLATFKWETAHTFEPVTERGPKSYFKKYDAGTATGKKLGNTQAGDGYLFRGRGYVQITGRGNYKRIGGFLGIDLVSDPDQALDPDTAYAIASNGMRKGWFTSKKLDDYIPASGSPNYKQARRIINGVDHAADIAAIAVKFEEILSAAQTESLQTSATA